MDFTTNHKAVSCETCGSVFTHIPNDFDASEIELVGFMETDSANEGSTECTGVPPKWICGNCFESFMAINPKATPIMFTFDQS